jgi:hypothetical protein
MPERKDARTPEKFLVLISKSHQLNTPSNTARALPKSPSSIIHNDIKILQKTLDTGSIKKMSIFVREDKKTAKNHGQPR